MVFGTEWQAFNLELPAKNEHIKTKELFWLTLSKLTVLLQAQSHISTRYYRILEFSRILNAPNTGKVRRFSSKVLHTAPSETLSNVSKLLLFCGSKRILFLHILRRIPRTKK